MSAWRKLAIIAGGGDLPAYIANACRSDGNSFHMIAIDGFADEAIAGFDAERCGIGQVGKLLRSIKEAGCDAVVLVGKVSRPNFKTLKTDLRGAAFLPKILAAAAKGDGAILQAVVKEFETEGVAVLGAEAVVRGLAAEVGALGAAAPDEADLADIAKASALIDALGPFDVGQAAVVAGGFVLSVEAAEGTDAMLERCAGLAAKLVGDARSGVLVKKPKPGQELRVDLPVIGASTIRKAIDAGLKGVAVQSGRALVLDRQEVIEMADGAGFFVYGFTGAEAAAP